RGTSGLDVVGEEALVERARGAELAVGGELAERDELVDVPERRRLEGERERRGGAGGEGEQRVEGRQEVVPHAPRSPLGRVVPEVENCAMSRLLQHSGRQ